MSDLLTLTWASDNEADQDTFNLLDFAQGLTISDGGWIPATMSDDQVTCTETMTFFVMGLSHDQIAGFTQKLDDWKLRVKWSHNPTQRRVVWLNARWKSETNTRRAMVWSLNYSLGDSPVAPFLRDTNFMSSLMIVIERGWWEELTPSQAFIPTMLTIGGKHILRNSIDTIDQSVTGDVPARIVGWLTAKTGNALESFWYGFRSSYFGSLANFVSLWELELSNYLLATSTDTAIVADATASAGNKITTTFAAGASLTVRARIRAADVTANYEDQRGLFICLMRAKMSDASIARVRAASGFYSGSVSSPYIVNPRVTVQGTSWYLYDLGTIRLPAIDDKRLFTPDPTMAYAGIELSAERVSGSGNLEMDCLMLIPINDAFIHVNFGTDQDDIGIRVNPAGYISSGGAIFKQGDINLIDWSLPANSEAPLVVFTGQRVSSHTLTDGVTTSILYVRRWRTLRGTE